MEDGLRSLARNIEVGVNQYTAVICAGAQGMYDALNSCGIHANDSELSFLQTLGMEERSSSQIQKNLQKAIFWNSSS